MKAYDRRTFLKATAVAGVTSTFIRPWRSVKGHSPNERLDVAVVGVANRGRSNMQGVAASENIVALCDIDGRYLDRAANDFPKARKYQDFRRLLEQKDIDAVVVNTPDHTHAVIALAAMRAGKHVYCEKPLAHSIHEARLMSESAAGHGVVTQMGNQGHSSDRLRSVVEFIRAGGVGPVAEVVTWSDKTWVGGHRPTGSPLPPEQIDWDLWLGPAPYRPYHPAYLDRNWRGWWDFGVGNFGDMACHILDAPYWALDLGYPERVSALGPPVHPDSAPSWLIVNFRFPARGSLPPVSLSWHDGSKAPPQELFPNIEPPSQGALFIGRKGRLLFPHSRGDIQLFDERGNQQKLEFPTPSLPRPEDHYQEWIAACKTGSKAWSDFAYGGRLTEVALAGIVAYRCGRTLDWDGPNMRAANHPEAARFIRRRPRTGWEI